LPSTTVQGAEAEALSVESAFSIDARSILVLFMSPPCAKRAFAEGLAILA
jgi:hypothetical protein